MRFLIYGVHNNKEITFVAGCETEAQAELIMNAFLNSNSWRDVFVLDAHSIAARKLAMEFTIEFLQDRATVQKKLTGEETLELERLLQSGEQLPI